MKYEEIVSREEAEENGASLRARAKCWGWSGERERDPLESEHRAIMSVVALHDRVAALEAENAALKAEVARLRSEPIQRPGEGTDWRAVAGDMTVWHHDALVAGGYTEEGAAARTRLRYDAAVARHTKGVG